MPIAEIKGRLVELGLVNGEAAEFCYLSNAEASLAKYGVLGVDCIIHSAFRSSLR